MSDPQIIRELAHTLWVERGCPIGSPETDWEKAERRLAAEDGAAESTSASDGRNPRLRAPDPEALPNRPPKNVEVQLEQLDDAPRN